MSKKAFDDLALRELWTEVRVSGQRVSRAIATTRDAPFGRPKYLKSWLKEEFKLMTLSIKCVVKCGLTCSEVDPFGQGLNYCATFKNISK